MLLIIHIIKQTHMGYTYMLQCFKSMFQTIKAHACMNDAHVYEMQVVHCVREVE